MAEDWLRERVRLTDKYGANDVRNRAVANRAGSNRVLVRQVTAEAARVPDIRKHLFKRFKVETGCRYLKLRVLVRDPGRVTQRREVTHTDITGRRGTTRIGEG